MAQITSCEQVCVMAMEMEEVGKDFYAALSGGSDDRRVRTFCALASGEEARHYHAFRRMREGFAQVDPLHVASPEVQEELRQLVSERVQPDIASVQKVALGGSLADALEMAIKMERDSILFYQALADRLPSMAEVLRKIIKEENTHLTTLRVLSGRE